MNVENLVDTSLQKVGTEICHVMSEIYGVVKCSIKKFVRKISKLMRVHLQCLFVQLQSESQLKILANKFEAFLWKVSFYRWNWWVTYFNSCSNNWWERLLLFIKKPFNFMAMGCWHKMYVLGL